jgi:hypothetical protein
MTMGGWDPYSEATPSAPVAKTGGHQPIRQFDPNAAIPGGPVQGNSGEEPARLGIRFVARSVDSILCGIIALAIAQTLFEEGTRLSNGIVVDSTGAEILLMFNALIVSVCLGVVSFAFFVVFESALGWTPGKKLCGLGVHASSMAGSPKPMLGQAALRNRFLLLLLIPIPFFNFVFLGISCVITAISIFTSATGQSRWDLRAETEVTKG